MTALEFNGSLRADGSVKIPEALVEQLKSVPSFRVLLLVPDDSTAEDEDKAWARLTEAEFFRGYSPSDSIYDDVQPGVDPAP